MKLKDFENYLTLNGKSTSTIRNYIGKIKIFLENVKVKDINEKSIAEFLLKIKEKNKPSTFNIYRSAIASLIKFLKVDIPLPKQLSLAKRLPEYFTEQYFKEEIIPTIEAVFTNPLKMKAILYFMFYTGIRVGEINNIKRKDIDLEKREAKIFVTKKNEERIVFFDEQTKYALKSFFSTELEETNAFNIKSETVRQHFYHLNSYFKDINFHPHLFRHSFSAMFRIKGGELNDLQELLGHTDIKSTQRYAGLKTKQRKEIYDKIMKRKG